MSRAFVKDDDDRPEPAIISARVDYFVTQTALAALDDDRRERAVVVETVAGVVGFSSRVRVRDERGTIATYEIVNDEDADPIVGKIGASSPLAQALTGAHAGAVVHWHRPVGDAVLTVESVEP